MESGWYVWLAASVAVLLGVVVVLWLRRRTVRRESARADRAPVSPIERFRRGLVATRRRLAGQIEGAVGRGAGDVARILPELQEVLVAADVGVRTSTELVERLRPKVAGGGSGEEIRRALRDEIADVLVGDPPPAPSHRPWVVLVLGVNGVGKTTTVGKLAALHVAAGRRVLLVAADTFRAAAIEQLAVWAGRTGAELVRQSPGASPAAVAFDGMKAALARGVDVVLVDSAGRLHTRANLVEELRKVERVIAREVPGAPHETLLVLDATTGQNALAQARAFAEALAITGLVITKLDGTARGGVAVGVRRETGVSIRYVGVGEGVDDLRPFDARLFADALLEGDPSEERPSVSVA
jgi:fused signal recognition particle receptor